MGKTKIIIDCDPGTDDAQAIMIALASDNIEIVAITTFAFFLLASMFLNLCYDKKSTAWKRAARNIQEAQFCGIWGFNANNCDDLYYAILAETKLMHYDSNTKVLLTISFNLMVIFLYLKYDQALSSAVLRLAALLPV